MQILQYSVNTSALFFLQNMANVISYLIVVNGWLLITSIKICKMLLVDILAVYVFQMLSFGIPGWRDQRHSRRIWSGSRNRATQFQNHQILALHMLPFWKSCLRRTPRHLSAISIMCTLHILQEAEWLEKRFPRRFWTRRSWSSTSGRAISPSCCRTSATSLTKLHRAGLGRRRTTAWRRRRSPSPTLGRSSATYSPDLALPSDPITIHKTL